MSDQPQDSDESVSDNDSAKPADDPGQGDVGVEELIRQVKTGEATEQPGDVPDPLYRRYRRLLARIEGLPELPMQAALAQRTLQRLQSDEVVWCLDQVLRGALWGQKGAMGAMMAVVWWLMQMRKADEYGHIKDYFEAAHDANREAVVDLFREVPPHQSLAEGQELPEVRMPQDREVTLGERRMIAAGPERRMLERLLMDPDPLVIRKLLDNPQIRLEDVQVVATRRPSTPQLLQEVVFHPRWFSRFEARQAVVRNPYADTGLVLKLLPTLGIKALRRIANSGDLHDVVQQSAQRLVTLREERTAPWRV